MIKKLLFVGAMIFNIVSAMDEPRLFCPKDFEDSNIKRSYFLTDKRDLSENEKKMNRKLFLLSHDLRRMKKQEAGEQLKFRQIVKESTDEQKKIIEKLAGLIRLVAQQRQIMQDNRYD